MSRSTAILQVHSARARLLARAQPLTIPCSVAHLPQLCLRYQSAGSPQALSASYEPTLGSQLEQLYASPQLEMLRSEMTAWAKEHRVSSSAVFKVAEADVALPCKWQAQSVDTGRPTNFAWPRLVFKCVPSASDQESLYRMAVQVAQIVGTAFAVLARLRYEESSQVGHAFESRRAHRCTHCHVCLALKQTHGTRCHAVSSAPRQQSTASIPPNRVHRVPESTRA
jgi:hypothetical protein